MTVLLPVHNGGVHLVAAVESVLAQTHTDFELLVVDDGSTDGTAGYLAALDDPRLRVVHQENAGLVASLNRGLAEARHEMVARMDADDVCAPDRLSRQVAALQAQPRVSAVGCCYEQVDESDAPLGVVHTAGAPAYLRRQLYFRNVLPHAGMTFRRSAVLAAGGYRDVGPCEDYDLWARLATAHEVASLPDILLRYRVTAGGISSTGHARQQACTVAVRRRLHHESPLPRPKMAVVVREGLAHKRTYGDTCDGALPAYLFDHLCLALLLVRGGRVFDGLIMGLAVVVLLVRAPSAALDLVRLVQPGGYRRPAR